MGDFFLDFRRQGERNRTAGESLRFFPDIEIDRLQNDSFDLMLTRSGSADMWAPYEAPDGTIVALAGRIALDSSDWEHAEQVNGDGGLACKAIYQAYQARGFDGIQGINGAYAIHLFEPKFHRYSLIFDAAGCYPGYGPKLSGQHVYCSHPDVLAVAIDAAGTWDYSSLATFLATGQVSHPYTYYDGVIGLDWGARYTWDLAEGREIKLTCERFANRTFQLDDDADEDHLAEELITVVSRTAKQVTQPRLGVTFIALSGGLDSRLLASQAEIHDGTRAFCIRGKKVNAEYRIAKEIADEIGIEMVPMIRDFDSYGDNAEMGVRISGGMGSIASNHFLGFRNLLHEHGCDNLVTGCYFDYLFKSLALDTKESFFLRREKLVDFDISSYLPYFPVLGKYQEVFRERLHEIIPNSLISYENSGSRLMVAARRTFPLCRDGDNIQRLIAQRVFDWYSPAVFHEILNVYWRTPISSRLDRSLFKKVVLKGISPAILRIPDNNTGVRIDATPLMQSAYRYRIALRRHFDRMRGQIDTEASWLNWGYYLRNSNKIRELWCRRHIDSQNLIEELTGSPFSIDIEPYLSISTHYFTRLLTLKLWAEQHN